MSVKSIVDVDVEDASFEAFRANFDKYKKQLDSMPEAWAASGRATKVESAELAGITAALLAHADLVRKIGEEKRKNRDEDERAGKAWKGLAKDTATAAGNILRATSALLRWTSLTSIVSGLLGAGGLFGIDRMAGNVAAGRRSALGLGLSYGEEKAFETNYGRVVDPNAFLAGVNQSLHDVTKRYALYGAGLRENDIRGKSTGEVSAELIPALKALADRTPDAQLQQVISSRGLDQFVSVEDMERLKRTSPEELRSLSASYARDRAGLGLSEDTQRRWQDFSTQMSRAGQQIENVFVRGLAPLAPGLEALSDSFAKSLKTFMDSGKLGEWMKDLGKGLESTAKYVSSDQFQKDVKTFVDDVGALAHWVANALKFLGIIPDRDAKPKPKQSFLGAVGTLANPFDLSPSSNAAAAKVVGDDLSSAWKWAWGDDSKVTKPREIARRRREGDDAAIAPASTTARRATPRSPGAYFDPRNNPGNLRRPGHATGFASFATVDDGIRAMARQLRIYQKRDHLDTIREIVSKYAPKSENDTEAYIRDVVRRTGFAADQRLDLSDKDQIAKLIAAMTKHENRKNDFSPKAVVTVLNNTGGSAIVSTSQVANQ